MDKIAIVGMGALFPDAISVNEYWNNIINRKDSLRDVPASYWDVEEHYDPDPTAEDKTYGKRGGFIDPVHFDSMEFGIPPKVMEATSVDQLFGLLVAKQAFEDAGLIGANAKLFNRERTGVILAAGVGKTAFALSNRMQIPRIKKLLRSSGVAVAIVERVAQRLRDVYLDWSEQANPGYLANLVAGRIANRFNLGGTNCSVDAACASSLSAVKFAAQELLLGSCDIMLTGGVNLDCSVFSFVSFSKTPAISKSNRSRPFDKEADGMMLGDGIGMFVLKRLADAERDGDRIYAVIRGIGSSSDGRGNSIFAPNDKGQLLALERAYEKTGVSPASVGLIEAHGTGTIAGDKVEINSLTTFLTNHQTPPRAVGLGSVKGQIGHTRLTAGAAGMMKAVLALYHKVLPPTINVTEPNPALALDTCPLYLVNEPTPWVVNRTQPVRRAAVNAFGFGGTNFHVVLEEYEKDHTHPYRLHLPPQEIVLHAPSQPALITRCEEVRNELGPGGKKAFYELLRSIARENVGGDQARIGMIAENEVDLVNKLAKAIALLKQTSGNEASHPEGIYYRSRAVEVAGKIVALFPGQGSQHPGMASQVAINYPELRAMLEAADSILLDQGKRAVSDLLYPTSRYSVGSKEEVSEATLTATEYTQPALAVVCGGLFKLLTARGFKADFFLGHSFGELTSLWAAGALSDPDFMETAVQRGKVMSESADTSGDPGTMLALVADPDTVATVVKEFPDVFIANYNAANQTIVAGSTPQVDQLAQQLPALGLQGKKLAVSAAFHTPFMAPAQQHFGKFLRTKTFGSLQGTVYCNATGKPYSNDPLIVKEQFAQQILDPVLFKQAIEHSYEAGGRLFVEIGPKKVLSSLVEQILQDREKYIVSLNPSPNGDAERQLREAIVQLKVLGVPLNGDPYQREVVLLEDKTNRPGVFEIHSEFFYTPEKTQKINQALEERTPLPEVVKTEAAPSPVPTVSAEKGRSASAPSQPTSPQPLSVNQSAMDPTKEHQPSLALALLPDHLIEIQKYSGSVLQEFLKTQTEQVKAVKEISDKQHQTLTTSVEKQERVQSLDLFAKYVDFANHLQHNSFHVYQAYFAEQAQLIQKQQPTLTAQVKPLPAALRGANPVPPYVPLPVAKQAAPAPLPLTPAGEGAVGGIAPPTPATNGTVAKAAVRPTATQPATPPAPAVSEELTDLGVVLLSIVSEKTGYPQEMLALDMSLEADLGIDSIKRVQIFSALNDQLPRKFSQENVEALAGVATLKDIVDLLQQTSGRAATLVPPAEEAPHRSKPRPSASGSGLSDQADTRQPLADIFLSIVSEKTGYPQEMLEADMHLEADLGIDSIKRVQLFSALNDQLPRKFSQEDVEALAGLSTIKDIIALISQTFDGAATATPVAIRPREPASVPAAVPTPSESALALTPIFLQIISEKTGYPPELLELDMNLEADLGIDSIKRVQLFSALNDQLPRKFSQSDVEALAGLSTISAILSYLEQHLLTNPSRATGPTPVPIQRRTIKRFEVEKVVRAPDADYLTYRIGRGDAIILTNDGQGVAQQLAERLQAEGARPILLHLSADVAQAGDLPAVESYTWFNEEESGIETVFKNISEAIGEVKGVIHTMPKADARPTLLSIFQAEEEGLARKLFLLAKYFYLHQLHNSPLADRKFFVNVVRMDGALGLGDTYTGKALQASLFGLTKSVKQEWENVFCRAIDLHPDFDARTAAELILKEIQINDHLLEVGRDIAGHRNTLTLKEVYRPEPAPQKPTRQDVFLVPGGGRGITAQCVLGLAQHFGCKFILWGRTEMRATLPAWAVDTNDKAVLRQSILAHYKRLGETIKPLEVDRLSTEYINQREINETIRQIRALGGDAIYQTCSVLDGPSVRECIWQATAQLGPITGFIHGAGNLADKKIQRKTLQDYEKVFDTKVKGLEMILQALAIEPLQYVVFFSSIAAYFGSGGQCDYSMANEVLNKFAFDLHKLYPEKRVCSINWGPWAGGMVTDTLKMVLEIEGVKIIEPTTGVQYLLDELQYGATNKVCQIVVNGSEHFRPAKVEANLLADN